MNRMLPGVCFCAAAAWLVAGMRASCVMGGEASANPTTSPVIPLPQIPAKTFNVMDYGAIADGKISCTAAIQKAIDECSKAGGGTVLFPAGSYLTGPFTLASNLNLHVEKNATILTSDNPGDYTIDARGFNNCIEARNCHDLAITGAGTIDGQGAIFWKNYVKAKDAPADAPSPPHRPYMIALQNCRRVLVQDILLTNAPCFHLVPKTSQDVTIKNIRIKAPVKSPNTDGIDPSGRNFLITGCTFDVGDDCIALKATSRIDPDQPACENFTIADCTFLHGHGMSIGGQSYGGLRHMVVRDSTFDGTEAGIRLKASRGFGGLVEDVTYENLAMKHVKFPIMITSFYPSIPKNPEEDAAQPVTKTTPIWRNIRISHLTSQEGENAGRILGLGEMPVMDVVLSDVSISAKKPMDIINARGIRFEDSKIVVATKGPAVIVLKSEVTGIDPATGK